MRKTLLVLLLLSILPFFWSCEPDDDPQDIYNIGPEVITTPKHTLSSDIDTTTQGPLFQESYSIGAITGIRP